MAEGGSRCARHLQLRRLSEEKRKTEATKTTRTTKRKLQQIVKDQGEFLAQKKAKPAQEGCCVKGCERHVQRGSKCDEHLTLDRLKQRLRRAAEADKQALAQDIETCREKLQPDSWRLLSTHSTYEAALQAAQDRRPQHEYGVTSSGPSDRSVKTIYLLCRGENCASGRRVRQDAKGWQVHMNDKPHCAHPPARAACYIWSPEQTKLLDVECAKGRHFTVNYLMRHLDRHGVLLGCTDEDMKKMCKLNNKQYQRWVKDDMNIEVLHAIVKEYGEPEAGDDEQQETDDNRPYLLPLPGGSEHIIIGDDVDYYKATNNGKQSKPRLLNDGTPHAFVFPFASLNSLSNITRVAGVLSYSLRTVTANGPEMDEVGDVVMGLADGVWGLVKGGIAGLLRVGVHTKGA